MAIQCHRFFVFFLNNAGISRFYTNTMLFFISENASAGREELVRKTFTFTFKMTLYAYLRLTQV